jgi:hypothetical protein
LKLSGEEDYANIVHIRAFFINTTLKDKFEQDYIKKNRFIGRFPIEPFVDEFEPTAYCINSTGYPRYRAYVLNEFRGYGVHPNWKKCFPITDVKLTECMGQVSFTKDPRVVTVLFPASAQRYPGVYQLLVVADIADSSYQRGVRTVTVNYNNIFELVSDSEECDADYNTQIEINSDSELGPVQDFYVVSGYYNDDNIVLQRNDEGGKINIDVSPISGWYERE